MTFSESRQRLRPWLESKIHSGKIPGLEWIDEDQTTFRMPWKHAGKQNWCEQDCLLFKEWAIHTGKFREGTDNPNWATWKTRLRCAFNKAPDIQEVKEKSCLDDENNPFRVYRLLPRSERQCTLHHGFQNYGAAEGSEDVKVKPLDYNSEASNDAYIPLVPTPVTLRSNFSDPFTSTSLPSDLRAIDSGDLVARGMHVGLGGSHSAEPNWNLQGSPPRDLSSQFDYMDTDESQSTFYADLGSPDATYMGCTSDPNGNDFENFLSDASLYPKGHRLAVRLSYSEDIFYDSLVANESGCRIYYGLQVPQRPSQDIDESTKLYGPIHLNQIELPPCDGLCVTPQRQMTTKKVLDSIDRGLILEIDASGSIYATRLCCCRIFVAMPFADGNPVKLERQKKTKVFDYQNEFLPAFTNYLHGNGPKPSVQVHFGFGQTWSCNQPFKKLLVKAVVVNCMALNQMHQTQNSNNSVNIDSVCLSEKDEYDELADRMKNQTLTPDISQIYNELLH